MLCVKIFVSLHTYCIFSKASATIFSYLRLYVQLTFEAFQILHMLRKTVYLKLAPLPQWFEKWLKMKKIGRVGLPQQRLYF